MKKTINIKNILIILLLVSLTVVGIAFIIKGFKYQGDEENVSPTGVPVMTSFLEGKTVGEIILSPSEFKKLDFNKLIDSNYISYKRLIRIPIDLYSQGYLLIDLDNRDAVYGLNNDIHCYPASLTKLITLDTILNNYDDLSKTSSFNVYQKSILIEENASLAYIQTDYDYTIKDLLYALILPSGADAAVALENFMQKDGKDLIQEMNNQITKLGLTNTKVMNSTGLHDDNHYTTLDDLFKVVWDILKYDEGKKILSTLSYSMEDGSLVKSTLSYLGNNQYVNILGGKTGYTGIAGENICVYYECDNHPYVLILYGADGNPYSGQLYHYSDVMNIMEYLYK